jgi:outer membrane immunogenic protein
MKLRIVAAAALTTLAAFGSAGAADLPMPAPVYKAPPPPVYNWTGCYIAGGGGYGWWNQDSQEVLTATGVPVLAQVTNGGKGWFGQGQGGCDYQFNLPLGTWNLPVVIGVFGDWEGGSIRGTSSTPLIVGSENESSSWAVGGRAGYLVTPRFLTYFDGGYTQARFDGINYNSTFAGGIANLFTAPATTYNGWFIGSGFEYAFDWLPIPGLFLKTEYRYSQYNSTSLTLFNGPAQAPILVPGTPSGAALNTTKFTQMVSTELVWRFNWFGH